MHRGGREEERDKERGREKETKRGVERKKERGREAICAEQLPHQFQVYYH